MNFREVFKIKGDKILWYVVVALIFISILVVYSTTGRLAYAEKDGDTYYYMLKQLVMGGGCVVLMFFVQTVNYKYFLSFSMLVLGISFVLLLYARFAGAYVNGAGRWIAIPIVGLTFQPSELAKIGIVMFTARLISFYQTEQCCEDEVLKKFLLFVGPVILLIFWDNFSTSALVGAVCFIMLFVGRLRLKLLAMSLGTVVGIVVLMVALVFVMPDKYVDKLGRLGTVKGRIVDFAAGSEDSEGYSFQSVQSKIAVAKGGLFGVGPGNSVQRNFLPHSYSDFAYAVVIEEYGLIGAGFIMLLYLIILYRIGVIVRRCTRMFPALLVTGLGVMLVLQAMINMGVCVGALPVTGQTLPFISMGGTSMLFMGVSVGIILSIANTFTAEGEREDEPEAVGDEEEREEREENVEPVPEGVEEVGLPEEGPVPEPDGGFYPRVGR